MIVLLSINTTLAAPYLYAPTNTPLEWKCSPYLNGNKTFIANQTIIFTGLACPKDARVVLYECAANCLEKTLVVQGNKIKGKLAEFRNYSIDRRYYYNCITCKDPSKNGVPIITTPESIIRIQEGKTVNLKASCRDQDGDRTFLSYSGWMNSNVKEIGYDEQGIHSVNIECLDEFGFLTKETVTIHVTNRNRPPTIEEITTS